MSDAKHILSRSKTLTTHHSVFPPDLLYHYTSPEGLIGIMKSKEMWATNTSHLNDASEQIEASKIASLAASNMARKPEYSSDEKSLLTQMEAGAGSSAKRFYVVSFSEDGDLLSQWRAYCPSLGGYAIGFPSKHLQSLTEEQGFLLIKCVYDHTTQYRIVQEIINSFIYEFRSANNEQRISENFRKKMARDFGQYIATIGPIIKHQAFSAEEEWRLISPDIDERSEKIEFRAGSSGVIPYFRFMLKTKKNPNLIKNANTTLRVRIGPTPDPFRSQTAVEFLLRRYIGVGAAHGSSDIPYRSW